MHPLRIFNRLLQLFSNLLCLLRANTLYLKISDFTDNNKAVTLSSSHC